MEELIKENADPPRFYQIDMEKELNFVENITEQLS